MKILSCNPYSNCFYIGATLDEYYKHVEKYVTDKERSDDYLSFYEREYLERPKGFYEDIKRLYRCDTVYDLYFIAKRDLSYVCVDYTNAPYFPYPERKRFREVEQVDIKTLEELKMVPMIAVNKYMLEGAYIPCIDSLNNNKIIIKSADEIPYYESIKERRFVCYYEPNKHKLEVSLKLGNIAYFEVDAVVNAANSELFPGSGVCGAIFSNAGYKQLYEECVKIGGCETGSAVITNGYKLKAKYIIHTVGPIYENDEVSAPLLKSAYLATLDIADGYSLKEIAIPSISTGVYGYPKVKACNIALDAILGYEAVFLKRVVLVCYDEYTCNLYFNELLKRNVEIKDYE